MKLNCQITASIILLALILVIFDCTSIDVWLQNHFYNAAAVTKSPLDRWLISKSDASLEFWFHRGIRKAVLISGVGIFLLFLLSFRFARLIPCRYRLLFLCVSMALVSLLVGGAKNFTNTYCPNQTVLYGGDKPYVKLFEHYPADFTDHKKGRCFPAGHATAGFGLMALYFVFTSRRRRMAGLAFGLTSGWVLGAFQMLRGEHFLSHTLFSMVASWLVILLTFALFRRLGYSSPSSAS